MAGSEKDIDRIADLITDDPDIFNEMAVSTGDVAFGVVGSVKRKKKKQANEDDEDGDPKIKKYFADPVTGQSKVKTSPGHSKEAGEVMMGDTQKEDSLEETRKKKVTKLAKLASKVGDKSTKGAVREIMQAINSADKHNVPLRWDQGLPMPDRRRGAINTGLEAAYTKVLRIVRRLSDLKVGPSCSLFKDWKRYRLYIKSLSTTASEFTGERKRQRGLPPNESQPEWQGNPVQRPPKGWWGNETWTAMELRKYYKTFLNEVCALYLQEAREFLTDHVSECENPKCHDKNHTLYLKDLFCGEDSLLDFSRSWDKHWTDRGAAIEKFKQLRLAGREEGRVAAPSTQQTLELAQKYAKMSPEERWAIPLHKMYPDEMEQLKQWHPKKKRKSKKSIFSMGFSELSYDEGDPVYHQEYGSGRVAADSPDDDAGVRVVFDRDLQRTVGGAGPGVMHPNKIKYIRKSSLEH